MLFRSSDPDGSHGIVPSYETLNTGIGTVRLPSMADSLVDFVVDDDPLLLPPPSASSLPPRPPLHLSDLLTILVTTSPVRSHPSTELLERNFDIFFLSVCLWRLSYHSLYREDHYSAPITPQNASAFFHRRHYCYRPSIVQAEYLESPSTYIGVFRRYSHLIRRYSDRNTVKEFYEPSR